MIDFEGFSREIDGLIEERVGAKAAVRRVFDGVDNDLYERYKRCKRYEDRRKVVRLLNLAFRYRIGFLEKYG